MAAPDHGAYEVGMAQDLAQESGLSVAERAGVTVALGLTTLFWWPPIASQLLPRDIVWRNLAAQGVDWAFALVLIAIVLFWERRPLRSLGLRKLTAESLGGAMGIVGFSMIGIVAWQFLITPGLTGLLPDPRPTNTVVTGELPDHFFWWYGPIALITAGIAEEVIYRGYAMERLLRIFRSPWPGLLLPHIAFACYHLKDGPEAALGVLVHGTVLTWFYYRTRDLTMLIVAHLGIDALALLGSAVGFS